MWRWLNSLRTRLTLLLALASVAGALIYAGVTQWPLPQLMAWLPAELTVKNPSLTTAAATRIAPVTHLGIYSALGICALLLLLLAFWLAGQAMAPVSRLLRALEGAVASYRDGDFSISIGIHRRDELGELICASSASILPNASCCWTPWCRTRRWRWC
jgi:two-component system nitrogen regulation sensor histidine kinase NtrY